MVASTGTVIVGMLPIVLGFQLLLVFLIFSAVFGLAVQAASVAQFAVTLALLAGAGTFFYFMVKAMARIQMPNKTN